jgi:nitric oxide reductase subunit C
MKTTTRRIIFGTLLSCFFIYTAFVFTLGTSSDKGVDSLTSNAVHGKYLFQKYNCGSCHQIYGLGGYMGPDLTNAIYAMLQNGSQRMPNFNLKNEEINSIIEYLNYINNTGVSPVLKFNINYDGTISQSNK